MPKSKIIMQANPSLQWLIVLALVLVTSLSGCATPNTPHRIESETAPGEDSADQSESVIAHDQLDIYRYFGWKDASTSAVGRTIFQDFSTSSSTIGTIWADPDSEIRSGRQAWVRSRISRRNGQPFLAVDYAREGYGTNIAILPREGTPLPVPKEQKLLFDLRSSDDACVGVRITERDAEEWGYGKPPLDYRQICPPKDGSWKTFSLPLYEKKDDWFHFPHAGNSKLGNKKFEADLLVLVTLELGFENGDYLGRGVGRVDVRNLRIDDDSLQ